MEIQTDNPHDRIDYGRVNNWVEFTENVTAANLSQIIRDGRAPVRTLQDKPRILF